MGELSLTGVFITFTGLYNTTLTLLSLMERKEMEEKIGDKSKENSTNRGIEGTSLDIPTNRHGNLISATSDEHLKDIFLNIRASKTPTVINYGASWCHSCSQILPAFHQLSNKFPRFSFVYADIDECPETTLHIQYTPTFRFYRDGERVDEMFGSGEERLQDRLWLHS